MKLDTHEHEIMLKMAAVVSYAPSIVYTIEKDSLKLVIMALNEAVDPMLPDILIYELRNQIFDKLRRRGNTTGRELVDSIYEDLLLGRGEVTLGFEVSNPIRGSRAFKTPLQSFAVDMIFFSSFSKILIRLAF